MLLFLRNHRSVSFVPGEGGDRWAAANNQVARGVHVPGFFILESKGYSMADRVWRLNQPDPALCRSLAGQLGISCVVAQILINRGICEPAAALPFLNGTLDLLADPFLFPGMDRAVERLTRAVQDREMILVYGDYDVDGVTSVSLLMRVLLPLARGRLVYYIPNRLEEGYGLNIEALERAAAKGVKVVVTVDCGVSAVDEARKAKELGLDLIITDHHEPPAELPEAVAVMDPKIPGCPYPFKDLAGVGMAYRLACALAGPLGISREALLAELDLVALGTVADIVPLVGENRVLVKYGLERINRTSNEGLKALIAVSGLQGKEISTGHLGFGLAPRINAAGRLGNSHCGVQLFLSTDPVKADELARQLDGGNRTRQGIETQLAEQASAQAESLLEKGDRRTLVLAGEGWHHGVIGIVASKIVERFYRPTVLVALEGDEGRGSGRSIPGFHLYQALEKCSSHLTRFGGHEYAAGLSIERHAVEPFSELLEALGRECLADSDMVPSLRVDAEIELSEATLELARQLSLLAPYGPSNPEPVLAAKDVSLGAMRGVGENGKHLKVQVAKKLTRVDGIGFGMGSMLPVFRQGQAVNLAFSLGENEWNGRTSVQLFLKDIKSAV